jgi:membrane associated rhomboid family serine protease
MNEKLRPNSFPPVVKNLIIINVLVWIAQITLESQFQITERISLYPVMPEQLHDMLVKAKFYGPHEAFQPYQIATHMFAHAALDPRGGIVFYHILFNMFALWMFGRILENVWGPKRFLLFYFACGVGAAFCHLIIQYLRCEQLLAAALANDPSVSNLLGAAAPAVGASGAIMGIFAAFGYLFPNTPLYIMFIPIPIKAKWAVIGLAAFDLFGGVANFSGDNVAHFAHLGGAITGFIIVLIWNKTNRNRFY